MFTGGITSAPSCCSQLPGRGGEGRGKEGGSHALQGTSCGGGEKTNSERASERMPHLHNSRCRPRVKSTPRRIVSSEGLCKRPGASVRQPQPRSSHTIVLFSDVCIVLCPGSLLPSHCSQQGLGTLRGVGDPPWGWGPSLVSRQHNSFCSNHYNPC